MKKILITGAGGLIGGTLFSKIQDRNPIGVDLRLKEKPASESIIETDLSVADNVKRIFDQLSPDLVFHFAALTSPQRNEKNVELARRSHIDMTKSILDNLKPDTHIVFLSTDKIFDGKDPCPDEKSPPNPLWIYGKLKLECEKMIQKHTQKYHILRLPIIHSLGDRIALSAEAGPGSFLDRAIRDLRDNKTVDVFDNVERCYLRVEELVGLLEIFIDDDHYGIYHVGTKMMSYYDRLRDLCNEIQLPWKNKLIPCKGTASPLKQNLNTSKLKNTFNYTLN